MPLSKHVIRSEQSPTKVVDFKPQKFPVKVPEPAQKFVRYDGGPATSFRISELVSQQIGITDEEKKLLEKQVQDMVLVELKKVEKEAYKEAYELGLDVGRKEAFDKYIEQYKAQFTAISELVGVIHKLTGRLVTTNEGRMVELVFYIAKRLAMDHMDQHKDTIVKVLKEVFENVQKDEKVNVKIAESDFEFIEEVRERMGEDLKFLEGSKLEPAKDIKKGGCLIETNYGVINATVEERVNRLWTELKERIPKVEDKISSSDGN